MKNLTSNISDILKKYKDRVDFLDLELIIAYSLEKERAFILSHPECIINPDQLLIIEKNIKKRINHHPIAHITEHKEFYGLDFKVDKHTLIPRPETETIVEQALFEILSTNNNPSSTHIIDIGTGSGNIIISVAHEILKTNEIKNSILQQAKNDIIKFFAIDKSKKALKIAKENAKTHKLNEEISFIYGNLLTPLIKNKKSKIINSKILILANLPYLSKEIYKSAPKDVRNYEPKSALYSPGAGLQHYRKLFKQIQFLLTDKNHPTIIAIIEFSPEQKSLLQKTIKDLFPKAKINFKKDLAKKWRTARIRF